MENPATWNDTQRAICLALYKDATAETDLTERAPQVLEILQAQGETSLDVEKIVELITQHRESKIYGASLPTHIWEAHISLVEYDKAISLAVEHKLSQGDVSLEDLQKQAKRLAIQAARQRD